MLAVLSTLTQTKPYVNSARRQTRGGDFFPESKELLMCGLGNDVRRLGTETRCIVRYRRFRKYPHDRFGVAAPNQQPAVRPVEPEAIQPIGAGVGKPAF